MNKQKQCIISTCSYEGQLLGLSVNNLDGAVEENAEELEKQEENNGSFSRQYNYQVTESIIQCIAGNQNLLALGGYDEVIRIFDIAHKKDLGSLAGEHTGTITSLRFHSNKFLISGSEDSSIILWRCSDWKCMHRLIIMNKSKIIDMSVHASGKMLLALYDNGVLRLWNLMTARCQYKKKMGLINPDEDKNGYSKLAGFNNDNADDDIVENPDQDEEEGEEEIDEDVLRFRKLKHTERKPILVKWWNDEESGVYAILYRRMLEVYDMAGVGSSDVPCSRTIFDREVTSFDFISKNAVVVADQRSDLFILRNIHEQDGIVLHIAKTQFNRLKELRAFIEPGQPNFLVAIAQDASESKLAFWSLDSLLSFSEDLTDLEPTKVFKTSSGRLTCLSAQQFTIKTGGVANKKKTKNRSQKREQKKKQKFEEQLKKYEDEAAERAKGKAAGGVDSGSKRIHKKKRRSKLDIKEKKKFHKFISKQGDDKGKGKASAAK